MLDLATGSGDLALAIARKLPQAEVTGADFSAEMLAVARRKGLARTVVADALHLPFEHGSLRLRDGGVWVAQHGGLGRGLARDGARARDPVATCWSSISPFRAARLRPFYRFYLHRCLPTLASVVTGQRDAYDYLGASIEKFPSGRQMLALIEANGFRGASVIPLTGGIATIYTAEKSG